MSVRWQIPYGKKERLFSRKKHRHRGRPDVAIAEWPKNVFKNNIVNRMWELLPDFTIWELWKTRNLRIFENKPIRAGEIWALIEAPLKEMITLIHWSQEDFTVEENEIIIIYELGIYILPVNNVWSRVMPKTVNNANSWL